MILPQLTANHTMKKLVEIMKSSVLAGVSVGIAGFGYLASRDAGSGYIVARELVGSFLFSFALLAVVNYKMMLYTGASGFVKKGEMGRLGLILLGNIIGCLLVALMARLSLMPLQQTAQSILESRLALNPLNGGILAIGCGFIMTTAVTFGRKGNNLPLLIGVPLFIICGFPHCVADAFYYLAAPLDFWKAHLAEILVFYLSIVVGNFIGCNFYRMIMGSNPE
jgi:formate/nitrite transporter FocA (FNT family)